MIMSSTISNRNNTIIQQQEYTVVIVCYSPHHWQTIWDFIKSLLVSPIRTYLIHLYSCVPPIERLGRVDYTPIPECEFYQSIRYFLTFCVDIYSKLAMKTAYFGVVTLVRPSPDGPHNLLPEKDFTNLLTGAYSLKYDLYNTSVINTLVRDIPAPIQKTLNIHRQSLNKSYTTVDVSGNIIAFHLHMIMYRPPGFFENILQQLTSQELETYFPIIVAIDDVKKKYFSV